MEWESLALHETMETHEILNYGKEPEIKNPEDISNHIGDSRF